MTAEEFIKKVKTALGELLPSDLIFEIQDGTINFYNESTPKSNSTLDFTEITSDEYDFYVESCVRVIKKYHI